MFRVTSPGSFEKTTRFLHKLERGDIYDVLDAGGRRGVDALGNATPVDTGLAAQSWYYEVVHGHNFHSIIWSNDDIEGGYNVAILIQYGHGTGTGGYVIGRDYINPAMTSVFDQIAEDVWREVTNA